MNQELFAQKGHLHPVLHCLHVHLPMTRLTVSLHPLVIFHLIDLPPNNVGLKKRFQDRLKCSGLHKLLGVLEDRI